MFTTMRLLQTIQIRAILLLPVVCLVVECLSSDRISDKRICADRECKTLISRAKAVGNHKHADPAFLSFKRGEYVNVYSKEAGSRKDLWGGELNGKTGYFPRSYVREMKAEVPNPQYEVETEPHIPLKDRVLGRTPPPPVQKTVEPEPVPDEGKKQSQEKAADIVKEMEQVQDSETKQQDPVDEKPEVKDTEKQEVNAEKDETDVDDDDTEIAEDETEIGEDETEIDDNDTKSGDKNIDGRDEKTDSSDGKTDASDGQSKQEQQDTRDQPEAEKDVPDSENADETDIDETELVDEEEEEDMEEDTELDETDVDEDIDADDIEEDIKEIKTEDETDTEEPDKETHSDQAKEVDPSLAGDSDKTTESTEMKQPEEVEDPVSGEKENVDETEISEDSEEEQGSLFGRMFSEGGEGKVSTDDNSKDIHTVVADETENAPEVEDNTKTTDHESDNTKPMEETVKTQENMLNKLIHKNIEDKLDDREEILEQEKDNKKSPSISEISKDIDNIQNIENEEINGLTNTIKAENYEDDTVLKSNEDVEISSSDAKSINDLMKDEVNLDELDVSTNKEVMHELDKTLVDDNTGDEFHDQNDLKESLESRAESFRDDKLELENDFDSDLEIAKVRDQLHEEEKRRAKQEIRSETFDEINDEFAVNESEEIAVVENKQDEGHTESVQPENKLDEAHIPEKDSKTTESLNELNSDIHEHKSHDIHDIEIDTNGKHPVEVNKDNMPKDSHQPSLEVDDHDTVAEADSMGVETEQSADMEAVKSTFAKEETVPEGNKVSKHSTGDIQDRSETDKTLEDIPKDITGDNKKIEVSKENTQEEPIDIDSKDTEMKETDVHSETKSEEKAAKSETLQQDRNEKQDGMQENLSQDSKINKDALKFDDEDDDTGVITEKGEGVDDMQMQQDDGSDSKSDSQDITETDVTSTESIAERSKDSEKQTEDVKVDDNTKDVDLSGITPTAAGTIQSASDTYLTNTDVYNTEFEDSYKIIESYYKNEGSEFATQETSDSQNRIQTSFTVSSSVSTEDMPVTVEQNQETVSSTEMTQEQDGTGDIIIDGTRFPAAYFGEPASDTAVEPSTPYLSSYVQTEVSMSEQLEKTVSEELQATTDIKPTTVTHADLPESTTEKLDEISSSLSVADLLTRESVASSSVHVLGTSFSYASSVSENTNTVPMENANTASVDTSSNAENVTETIDNVEAPTVHDGLYGGTSFISRKPLSSGSPSEYTEASADNLPDKSPDNQPSVEDTTANNLNDVSMNKDANYQKDLNIPVTEETSGDFLNDKQLTTPEYLENEKPSHLDDKQQVDPIMDSSQIVTPPTSGDKQSSDEYISISRKVPDPLLDEELVKPQPSLLQSLEPTLKYIVYMLPPSVLSILEQEPLGLSPTMAVLVSLVSGSVLFLGTCLSCICRGEKKSTKQDPVVIIRGLEEKLFITTKEKENLEDELQIQSKKAQQLEHEVHTHQSTSGTVEMDMKTVKLHNEAMKKQVSALQQEVTDYKHEVTEKATDIKQKTSIIAQYESELQAMISRSQESEQLIQKTRQSLSEKEDEVKLLHSQVESFTEQVNQQETRKQQLEEEAAEWSEKVRELTEQVDQFTQESRRMQEDLAFKENELEVLRDCFLQVKAFQGEDEMKEEPEEAPDLEEKLKAMMDVSRINASLRAVEEERDVLQNKLRIEVDSRKDMEDQMQKLKGKMDSNQADKMKAERQCQEAQTRLEVLSKYFKEKEAEMSRQLGEQEVLKNQNLSKLQSSDSITVELNKENEGYRQQIEELKTEITKADRDFRSQIAANEKKAHENWLATRTAERELKESRHECGMLRQKLTDLERKLMQGPPGLIRPITHRAMPPPGMLNGPPPPPPPERPGSRGSVHGRVTPRLRDDDFIGSSGPDRMPPPDRRLPPGARPPPPPMDARSPPPYAIRPPFPPDRRSPPPFDRYAPPRGPMGPRGPRPPFPGGPPPHLVHSPPSRSPPADLDDSRQGQGRYRVSPNTRDRGPPPPRHQSQV